MSYKPKKGEIVIDISRRLEQRGDSFIGALKYDNKTSCIILKSDVKSKIKKNFKGKIVNLLERVYCIMTYEAVKDWLSSDITKVIFCGDYDKGKLNNYFKSLLGYDCGCIDTDFKGKNVGHYIANKCKRKKSRCNHKFISYDDIKNNLLRE